MSKLTEQKILAKFINSNSCSFNSSQLYGPFITTTLGTRSTYWIYCLGLLGGLWTFIAFHGLIGLIAFSLRQFEIARLVLIRPYNDLHSQDQ